MEHGGTAGRLKLHEVLTFGTKIIHRQLILLFIKVGLCSGSTLCLHDKFKI